MIERITKNEERLDKIVNCLQKLEEDLNEFKSLKKDISLVNRYYGSSNWFKDKEAYERNLLPKIKAGVLTEDAVWDMNDDIKDLLKEMKMLAQ